MAVQWADDDDSMDDDIRGSAPDPGPATVQNGIVEQEEPEHSAVQTARGSSSIHNFKLCSGLTLNVPNSVQLPN